MSLLRAKVIKVAFARLPGVVPVRGKLFLAFGVVPWESGDCSSSESGLGSPLLSSVFGSRGGTFPVSLPGPADGRSLREVL